MPDIRFYLALFLRRIHYFLIFTALGSAIGITLATILPPVYMADARLVVESEQIPGNLAQSTVRTEATEQIQIIRQRILTRATLLDMANRLNVYPREPGASAALRPDEMVSDMRDRIRIRTRGGDTRRNQPAEALLVDVGFSAGSPELAANVANEVVTLMLQENRRIRTGATGETLDFFQQEVDRLDRELAERGARIVAFQNENREALPESLEFRRSQLTNAQERLVQIDRDTATLNDRRESLVALFEATGGAGLLEDQAALTPEARELERLKERLARSVAAMSLDNIRVRVLRQQIAALEEIVAQQQAEAAAEAAGTDAISADGTPLSPYEIQLADIDTQLEFMETRRAEIEAEMERLGETIAETPENAIALDTLRRDYANVRSQFDQAVANRARAETGDIIESLSKGERITVLEQAVAPREPTSPDRPRLIMMGVGGGMMMGLGLIVLLELLVKAIRRPVDLIDKLEITPIGTLSFIRTRGEILRRRAAIATAFVVVLAGIPAGLWAIETYYMPLDLLLRTMLDRLPVDLPLLSYRIDAAPYHLATPSGVV